MHVHLPTMGQRVRRLLNKEPVYQKREELPATTSHVEPQLGPAMRVKGTIS